MKTNPLERRERLARASAARAERDGDVGIIVICVGVAIFLFAFLIVCILWYTRLTRSDFLRFPLMVVLAFSAAVVAQGRRMRVRSGERVLAADERAAIVYLRSFDDDGDEAHSAWRSRVRSSGGWGGTFRTYEEQLARTLRKVGPFVAIGNPTEDLPELGAARVYATDEDWHTTVDELTARAGVVLLQTGDSEGLAWEVDHVLALGAPERVILGLPPPGKRKRRHRYETFRRRFGALFPQHLPESIGDCQFVYFDADWTPRLLGQRGVPLPEGDTPRDVTLRRLARTFKITWGPRWVRMAVYVLGFFVAFGVGDFLTGDLTSRMRVDDCVSARVPQLQALSPPFVTTGSAARKYARAECQALEDKHLLAGGGKLASPAATRLRCERYTDALYDYEPANRRGARRRWSQVAIRYCATPAVPDPGDTRLLRTAAAVNRR